jgi:hypothetical protein
MAHDFLNRPLRTEAELDEEAAVESVMHDLHRKMLAAPPIDKAKLHAALGGTEPLRPDPPGARPVTDEMIAKGYMFDT